MIRVTFLDVLVFCYWETNYSISQWLQTTSMYYLTVTVDQGWSRSLGGPAQGHSQGCNKVTATAALFSSIDCGGWGSAPQAHSRCWWLASQDPFLNSLLWASTWGSFTPWPLASCRAAVQERVTVHARLKSQSFYNLILKVTSHHICHTLSINRKPINPPYTQGEGITGWHWIPGGRNYWGPS